MPLMPPPPRTLDVQLFAQARAAELDSLQQALKRQPENGCLAAGGALHHHLWRRTSSHSRGRRRRKRKVASDVGSGRRTKKRRRETLRNDRREEGQAVEEVSEAAAGAVGLSNPDNCRRDRPLCRRLRRHRELRGGTFSVSSDGTRRLATHVWHAKRFSMTKRWGSWLPLGRVGRGRGSRAVLRWAKHAALLQDASFYSAIQISGPQEPLLKALELVLEPSSFVEHSSEEAQLELSGACFGTAMLHEIENPSHGKIAPVLLMWCPALSAQGDSLCNAVSTERHLWIWVHPAAFDDALQLLMAVSLKLNEDLGQTLLKCSSRQGDLARIDILGAMSFQVLQKVLHPVSRGHPWSTITVENDRKRSLELSQICQPDGVQRRAVITLEVLDPRYMQGKFCPTVLADSQDYLKAANRESCSYTKKEFREIQDTNNGVNTYENCGSSEHGYDHTNCQDERCNKASDKESFSGHFLFPNTQISNSCWASLYGSAGKTVKPPVSEKMLSDMRHLQRLAFFKLDGVSSNSSTTLAGHKEHSIFLERSVCPIFLLKHDSEKPSSCGWSIILPSSWVWAFWVPMVFAGGHVIGLRERHWLSTDAGVPFFPHDFPDCPAFESTSLKADGSLGLANKHSASTCLQDALVSCCSSNYVARTAEALSSFMKQYKQSGFFFPEWMQVIWKIGSCEGNNVGSLASLVQCTSKVDATNVDGACLVQVLIRTAQKGVLEEGTVLLRPTPEDFNVWQLKRERFKLSVEIDTSWKRGVGPNSGQPNEASTINCPTDSRKTVGFVTSGSPHGCPHVAAIGFCNAIALLQVQASQCFNAKGQDSEIFLLAHNKRSNMYRPVLTSVALQKRKDAK